MPMAVPQSQEYYGYNNNSNFGADSSSCQQLATERQKQTPVTLQLQQINNLMLGKQID